MTTEETLLRRLRADEPAALEDIISVYSPYVFAVLSRRLGFLQTAEDVEELASDVFFSLWQSRSRIRTGLLRGWLSKVAENRAKDFLRKKRLQTVSTEDCLELPDAQAEKLQDAGLRRLLVQQTLDGLDGQTREIFTRYYFEDQSTAQIAAALDLQPETVKSRLKRGRQKLKTTLTEGGFTLAD